MCFIVSSSFEIAAMTKNTADRLIFLGNITQQTLGVLQKHCTTLLVRECSLFYRVSTHLKLSKIYTSLLGAIEISEKIL